MSIFYPAIRDDIFQGYLGWAFLFSILLHILVVVLVFIQPPPVITEMPRVIDVVFEPPRAPERQIVTPPDIAETKEAPLNTNQLSDKNFKVEREQIKRGDAGGQVGEQHSEPVVKEQAPSPKEKQVPKPVQKTPKELPQAKKEQHPGPLKTLTLDESTMLERYKVDAKPKEVLPQEDSQMFAVERKPRPFSRPMGSGAAFMGAGGTTDYLPDLPDGDITLLNAKADKFAVFVRRVATRVFSELRTAGWESLRAEEVRAIQDFSQVRAILSPDGKLLKVILEGPSGSVHFDEVVDGAVQRGASDPHPPKEAIAVDGNYHFIFQAKSWVDVASGRHGELVQRRWLLLGTGLE